MLVSVNKTACYSPMCTCWDNSDNVINLFSIGGHLVGFTTVWWLVWEFRSAEKHTIPALGDDLVVLINKELSVITGPFDTCGRHTRKAPFHQRFFHRNSNSMESLFFSHLDSNKVIATKFCTWHNSCAVVACAKICCDLMNSNSIMIR